jgi:thiamine monophosphate synthase
MRTKKLIQKLKDMVREHGNIPVVINGDGETAKEVSYEVVQLSGEKIEWISIST